MTPEEKKLEYRNRIVEEIWKSKVVHNIAYMEAPKRGISWELQVQDDVVQTIFLHLMKMNPDTLIELYEFQDKPFRPSSKLVNYLGRMVSNDGYTSSRGRPNECVATSILFASTLRGNLSIDTTVQGSDSETDNSDTLRLTLAYEETPENPYEEMWTRVEKQLSKEDLDFLTDYLYRKRGDKKADRKRFRNLCTKIEGLVKQKPKPAPKKKPKTTRKNNFMIPVHQLDLKGNHVRTFQTLREASNTTQIAYHKLWRAVSGRNLNNVMDGYRWSYAEEVDVTVVDTDRFPHGAES